MSSKVEWANPPFLASQLNLAGRKDLSNLIAKSHSHILRSVSSLAGGIFDPFGLAKQDSGELRLKEIKNGRLAMLAFAGFVAQARTTGETPLDNLTTHLADPWGQNVFARKLQLDVPCSEPVLFSPFCSQAI